MSAAERHDPSSEPSWAVDAAIAGVTVVVVLSLGRLFTTWDYAPRLVTAALLAHGVAIVTRRLRWPVLVGAAASVTAGAIAVSLLYLPKTTRFGLPTAGTVRALSAALDAAFEPFRKLVAPVDATLGFQLALAIGLWVVATFADAAVNRADAPVQAATPLVATFLFGSVLARGLDAVAPSLGLAGALCLLWLAVRHRRGGTRHWVTGDQAQGPASDVRWGVATAGAAFVLAALTNVGLPEASTRGVVDLRRIGQGDGPTVVDSPMVGMTSLLGARSGEAMFDVRSPRPHYWRLTALETFDGDTWSSNASYQGIDGEGALPGWDERATDGRERHDFEVRELRSQWLPAAYEPVAADLGTEARYHRESGSLFMTDPTRAGQRYRITSRVVDLDAEAFRSPPPASADTQPSGTYLRLPDALRRELVPQARSIVALADTPLDRALALERFFQDPANGFRYDERADYRDADDPVLAFLAQRNGFCQQYAGTFAAMARSLGMPARVAVGFTYGDRTEDGHWTVRGRHAHAWPEVFIAGAGWLPFEPTPGRGNPDAQPYSGRAPAQAAPADGSGGQLGTTTTTAVGSTSVVVPTTSAADLPGRDRAGTGTSATSRPRPIGLIAAGGLGLAAMAMLARWAWARRRRRGAAGASPERRVAHAWRRGVEDLRIMGVAAEPTESPLAFARRAGRVAGPPVQALAEIESSRRYRAAPVDESEAEQAEAAARELRELVGASMGRVDRVRFELDLFGRPRSDGGA